MTTARKYDILANDIKQALLLHEKDPHMFGKDGKEVCRILNTGLLKINSYDPDDQLCPYSDNDIHHAALIAQSFLRRTRPEKTSWTQFFMVVPFVVSCALLYKLLSSNK